MNNENPSNQPQLPRIVFLYSDAGGGHRSAAEAIIEALLAVFPGKFESEMINVFTNYARKPLHKATGVYRQLIKTPELYKHIYNLTDTHLNSRIITSSIAVYSRKQAEQLLEQHPADLFVSVYHFASAPILEVFQHRAQHPPFITVVTDLVSTPSVWYDRRVDLCLVPTEGAKQRALEAGLKPEQVKITGLPVSGRFTPPPDSKTKLKQGLKWPTDLPTILIMAGGEGIAPLETIVTKIAKTGLQAHLAVVTGRNADLQQKLSAKSWDLPVTIYGFVTNMPELMRASDVLLTKAGPGTISEALNSELPMLLYSRIPGQEDGNVDYVVNGGAGLWTPTPAKIVTALKRWIEHPQERVAAAMAGGQLAQPAAAIEIAHIIGRQVGLKA